MFSIHHVQLAIPVGAEDRARAFYAGVLGLEEVPKPTALAARGGAWFRGAGIEIHLGVQPDFVPAAKAHPGIQVDDLDALQARFEAHDVQVRPDDNFPGLRRFYVSDPFGNRLEFLQPAA